MADTTHRAVSFYIILVGVLALVTVCGCAACAFILSHLHRKRKKQQAVPQEEGINNQREFVNLIRNVDRPVPQLPPAAPLTQPPPPAPVSRCYEEIELTLPPSPAPSHSSPALKPAHAPKLDISNQEREKLNRFHYTENPELEAWPLNFWASEELFEIFKICVVRTFSLTGTCFQFLALCHWCSHENGVTWCDLLCSGICQRTPEERRLLSRGVKKSYFVVFFDLILTTLRNIFKAETHVPGISSRGKDLAPEDMFPGFLLSVLGWQTQKWTKGLLVCFSVCLWNREYWECIWGKRKDRYRLL